MAITPDGWFTWADRYPGPANRASYMGGQPTSMTAITHHSLEGWLGDYSALTDPARFPTSWHWTVPLSGNVQQHYPVTARLVHGNAANVLGPGGESEGLAPTPLNASQIAHWLHIHADIEVFTGKKFERIPGSRRGLVEHREMGPTACPSERYAPLWAAISGGTEMPDPRVDEIIKALGGAQLLKEWNDRGNSLLKGYADEQQDQGVLEGIVSQHLAAHPSAKISPALRALEKALGDASKAVRLAAQVEEEREVPHV